MPVISARLVVPGTRARNGCASLASVLPHRLNRSEIVAGFLVGCIRHIWQRPNIARSWVPKPGRARPRSSPSAPRTMRAPYSSGLTPGCSGFHHVLETPNTVRGERLFAQLIAESVRNGGRVLDIGCATGQTARQAVELGAGEVLAVDLSQRFLEEAERLGDGEGKIEYRLHDLHDSLDGRFDLIVGRAVLHHIDWRSFLQRTFADNLQPGGQMVFMEPMTHPMTVAFHRLVRSAHTPGEYPLSGGDVRWLGAKLSPNAGSTRSTSFRSQRVCFPRTCSGLPTTP